MTKIKLTVKSSFKVVKYYFIFHKMIFWPVVVLKFCFNIDVHTYMINTELCWLPILKKKHYTFLWWNWLYQCIKIYCISLQFIYGSLFKLKWCFMNCRNLLISMILITCIYLICFLLFNLWHVVDKSFLFPS